MTPEITEFFRLLDVAGQLDTKMDTALGKATERQAVGDYAAATKHIAIAHNALGKMGLAHKDLETWGTQQSTAQPPPVIAPPPTTTLPPPSAPPAGVKFEPDWGATEYGNRNLFAASGQTYAIRFQVPRGPFKDAAPQVVGSLAIVPSGSGAANALITDTPQALDPSTSAGGVGYHNIGWRPEYEGQTKYLCYRIEVASGIHVSVQLPHPL